MLIQCRTYLLITHAIPAIECKFSAPRPGSDIVRVVWRSNDKHPYSSTIQLHVLHEGAAKEYGLKQVD